MRRWLCKTKLQRSKKSKYLWSGIRGGRAIVLEVALLGPVDLEHESLGAENDQVAVNAVDCIDLSLFRHVYKLPLGLKWSARKLSVGLCQLVDYHLCHLGSSFHGRLAFLLGLVEVVRGNGLTALPPLVELVEPSHRRVVQYVLLLASLALFFT